MADDLTGACDAAAPFAPATVSVNRGTDDRFLSSVEPAPAGRALALSTESRDLEEREIVTRIRAISHAFPAPDLLFKKIDSTLRGNVQAEVHAAMQAFRCTSAIVTPAFPDMGRTVQNGHLLIHGVVQKAAGPNVLDAQFNQDLDRIVETGLARPGRVLWAGSAGLAAALARRLFGAAHLMAPPQIAGPTIFCIGSDHPATQTQQSELARQCPESRILTIRRFQTTAGEIRAALVGAAALFITGGDTASMVLRATGAQSIAIRHEVTIGVPWGLLKGGMLDGCPIVTKSGGFGPPDTLIRVAGFFSCPQPLTNQP